MAAAVLIAVSHGVVDMYAAFLHPLLPRIMDKLDLSITLASVLSMAVFVAVSVLQPVAGYLSDRFDRGLFVAAGPLLAGVFFSLIGVAPSFTWLVVCLILGGLGASSFHPPGAAIAARAQEGKGSGLRFSLFSFGGAAGFAIGPLVAVGIVERFGFEMLWVAMFPGIVLAFALWSVVKPDPARHTRPRPDLSRVATLFRGPLGLIFGVSVMAAFVQRVFVTMMPIIVDEAGGSEATGAVVLSVYLAAQALGTLTGGWLADRVDRRHILIGATAIAAPLHLLAVVATPASAVAVIAAGAAGFLNMALLPPIVVMAQEMLPGEVAISSGIVMGLAWVPGSFGVLLAGVLGDAVGPVPGSAVLMPTLLLGTLLALHPSLRRYGRPAALAVPGGSGGRESPGG